MQPQDIRTWLSATPFRPFRMTMNSGHAVEIRHPELVRLMPSSLMLFTPGPEPLIFDRAEMYGRELMERIEPLDIITTKKNGPA